MGSPTGRVPSSPEMQSLVPRAPSIAKIMDIDLSALELRVMTLMADPEITSVSFFYIPKDFRGIREHSVVLPLMTANGQSIADFALDFEYGEGIPAWVVYDNGIAAMQGRRPRRR